MNFRGWKHDFSCNIFKTGVKQSYHPRRIRARNHSKGNFMVKMQKFCFGAIILAITFTVSTTHAQSVKGSVLWSTNQAKQNEFKLE